MEIVCDLLEPLAPVLYGGIGLLLLITLRQVWRAHRRLAHAFFRVEREMVQTELLGRLAEAGLLLILGLGLWLALDLSLPRPGPVVPSPTFMPPPSPTRPVLGFPFLAVPPPRATEPLRTPTPVPSPSPSPEPSPTPSPSVPQARCPDPNAQLEAPAPGQVISQPVTLVGTATHPAFQFYKVEIRGPYTGGQWVTLGEVVRQPVIRGPLWAFDPSPFFGQPGAYWLRLVVVDQAAQEAAYCEVLILIQT
jgi:hypothetical protein